MQIFLETNCFFLSNCVRSGDGCEESENTRNMIAEFEKVLYCSRETSIQYKSKELKRMVNKLIKKICLK